MSPEPETGPGIREFRLEGLGLALIAAVAIVLLACAFWLGRWYERTRPAAGPGPAATAGSSEDADSAAGGTVPETDTTEGLTYFDTVEGGEKEAETWREARPDPGETTAAKAEHPAPPEAPEKLPGGPWFVQVFAGRDRASAENIAARLGDLGYPVKIHTVREGQSALFKVGVGGYPSRDQADARVAELKDRGFESAWTNRFD